MARSRAAEPSGRSGSRSPASTASEAVLRRVRTCSSTEPLRAALVRLSTPPSPPGCGVVGRGTACASDSKKFGSWSSNVMTELQHRYCGPGMMIYWHVERKSLCVYSQLTSAWPSRSPR
ncbi:Tn3 family transposase [Streptomyces sp. enrichment culture]|uniref:Tn3 family transposase n=1 Tax=Streptomyces sp. enrichment culture TaxID=1795815 RepID=UPI003F551CA6